MIHLSCAVLLGVRRVDLEGGLADAVRCPRGRGCGGILPHSAHNHVQVQGHATHRRASALRAVASQSGHESLITGMGGGGGACVMHGRSRMTVDPRIPTVPGQSTSGFHRPGRHCSHQGRSAVRCCASGGLLPREYLYPRSMKEAGTTVGLPSRPARHTPGLD